MRLSGTGCRRRWSGAGWGLEVSGEAEEELLFGDPLALRAELPAAEPDEVVLQLLDAPMLLGDDGFQDRWIIGERRDRSRHPQG
jgi:hypothetical protein